MVAYTLMDTGRMMDFLEDLLGSPFPYREKYYQLMVPLPEAGAMESDSFLRILLSFPLFPPLPYQSVTSLPFLILLLTVPLGISRSQPGTSQLSSRLTPTGTTCSTPRRPTFTSSLTPGSAMMLVFEATITSGSRSSFSFSTPFSLLHLLPQSPFSFSLSFCFLSSLILLLFLAS